MSKFQILFIAACIVFTIAGLLMFSFIRGKTNVDGPAIVIWGTLSQAQMFDYIEQAHTLTKTKQQFIYVQKREETFDRDVVEALAIGKGPDAVLLPQQLIWKYQEIAIPIPYETLSDREFKDTFIQEGELYMGSRGIYAIPFSVDPLVMYWNRDMFNSANVATPPKYWEEFLTLGSTLTEKDEALNIVRSAVALGEFRNITHAKDILSLLIMQAGNPITVRSEGGIESVLSQRLNNTTAPTDRALTFFTQFADPRKDVYSWSRSQRESKLMFSDNRLAIYFGRASELQEIRLRNPNLNFDVAAMPQPQPVQGKTQTKITFGQMHALAIIRGTQDAANTLKGIQYLTSKDVLGIWTEVTSLPSVRRDVLSINPTNAASAVFAASALWSRGWLDPNASKTSDIFRTMVEGVTSGRYEHNEAIQEADGQIQALLQR